MSYRGLRMLRAAQSIAVSFAIAAAIGLVIACDQKSTGLQPIERNAGASTAFGGPEPAHSPGTGQRYRFPQSPILSKLALIVRDPNLERFYKTVWRPAYVREAIEEDANAVPGFDPQLGLFPDGEEGRILLNTHRTRIVFWHTDPNRTGPASYSFADGRLRIEFESPNIVTVQYVHRGSSIRERYVQLDLGLDEAIAAIGNARRSEYDRLRAVAERLESDRYGTIVLQENRKVEWTDRERLVPQVIPADAAPVARIRFDINLSSPLSQSHSGAFSLFFDLGSRHARRAIAYKIEGGSVGLAYIPERFIELGVVQSIPTSVTRMRFVTANADSSDAVEHSAASTR